MYGEEDDPDLRRKLEDLLNRAVDFACKAQTSRGGWGYVSAADGNDFDEGSVSVTQVQALRAARNAGIVVPKEAIDKVQEYLQKCTTEPRRLDLQPAPTAAARERPTITVAAIASMFSTGEYDSKLAKRWIEFVKPQVPIDAAGSRPVRPLGVHALLLRPGDLLHGRGRLRQAVPRLQAGATA